MILLVLLQIFNISISGIGILFILVALVVIGKWDFVDGRWIIILINIFSGLYIILSFIASFFNLNNYLNFLGLQSLQS